LKEINMTKSKMIASSLLVVVAAGLIAYPVFAHCGKCAADARKIAAQLDQNNMTLAKMVSAAEEHSKGRAISVISDLREKDQAAVYVYCVAGDPPKVMMCHVNIATGKVLGMKETHEFPITAPHAEGGHGAHDPHAPGDPAHGGGTTKMIKSQTVEAGCGACIYKMAGVEGCPLAVMIDGKPYLVQGATWPNHDYCDGKQQAIVSGKLEGARFIATSVEPKK
jgi:bacterioferritin-associated ferredoxin